jgi:hypothetical protein
MRKEEDCCFDFHSLYRLESTANSSRITLPTLSFHP